MLNEKTTRRRVQLNSNLTLPEVRQLAENQNLQVLQTRSPIDANTWQLINEELLVRRPDVEIRVYGFYGQVCDLSFLQRMTELRRFSADCLHKAVGIEHLAGLDNLERLSIGIYDLETFDFLADIPSGLRELALAATKSKKPRLDALPRFAFLQRLYLEGQQRGIEALAHLTKLERLTLRSISTPDLTYIRPLRSLVDLEVKLGGIRDFSTLAGKTGLRYLELWQIRGLRDLGFVSTLTGLQYLFLQSLRNVIAIPDFSQLGKLRRLYLENMKALTDVSALLSAPVLTEFIHVSAQNMQPEQYADLAKIPTLKRVLVGFGSRKKNQELAMMMQKAGKEGFQGGKFVFI